MLVKLKRVDTTLPLPRYQTTGAVAFDLYCRVATTIASHAVEYIPTNIIVQIPQGFFLLLAARSSTLKRTGLMMANGIGIIDNDFCGDEDEIRLALYNTTNEPVTVARGERIGQALFLKTELAEFEETDNFKVKSRGGFGTTGTMVD